MEVHQKKRPLLVKQVTGELWGHSSITLWLFATFLTPPSPLVILCYKFLNPLFTITLFLDNPPPLEPNYFSLNMVKFSN